jgi:hypothetical protein
MNRPPGRTLSAAFLLLAGFLAAGAAKGADLPAPAEVPMFIVSGRPAVDVSVPNYPPFKMVVDTGNETSILDITTAVDMGLDLKALAPAEGKPGAARYSAVMKDVHVGEAALGDLPVVVMDLRQSTRDGTLPPGVGSLGVAVFSGRVLSLDFKGRRVGISATPDQDSQVPRSHGASAGAFFGRATLAWW